MHRLWGRYCEPLIEALEPRRIMEIGAHNGGLTRPLLEYCRRADAFLDIVDLEPPRDLHEVLALFESVQFALHEGQGVDRIPALPSPDLVVLTSDPNWRTAFMELSALAMRVHKEGRPMPVVLAHACGWPYARRDMYRHPRDWREDRRKPFAYKGMLPGVVELVDDGVNGHCANALFEGGAENGVLTALEDFVAVHSGISLRVLPFFGGLGILIPDARLSESVRGVIEGFFSPDALMDLCQSLELNNNRARAGMLANRRLLEHCSDELASARVLLQQRSAQVEELRRRQEVMAGRIPAASDALLGE